MSKPTAIILNTILVTLLISGWLAWSVDKASDKKQLDKKTVTATQDEERERRSSLRAYYGAPPVIPHEITPRNFKECLHCHAEIKEFELDDRVSVKTPHAQLSSCTQCHVPTIPLVGEPTTISTNFKGLKEPKGDNRANPFAPPTIPHSSPYRESSNCTTCHSVETPYEILRFDHPERSSCQQCHVQMDTQLVY